MEGSPHPGEVLVAVPDGFSEGRVVGEQRLHAGAGVREEVLLLRGGSRLLQHRNRFRPSHFGPDAHTYKL